MIVAATALLPQLSALWAVTGGLFIVANNAPDAWDYVRDREGNLSKSNGDTDGE